MTPCLHSQGASDGPANSGPSYDARSGGPGVDRSPHGGGAAESSGPAGGRGGNLSTRLESMRKRITTQVIISLRNEISMYARNSRNTRFGPIYSSGHSLTRRCAQVSLLNQELERWGGAEQLMAAERESRGPVGAGGGGAAGGAAAAAGPRGGMAGPAEGAGAGGAGAGAGADGVDLRERLLGELSVDEVIVPPVYCGVGFLKKDWRSIC